MMINPDGVRHQIHGNVIQSTSRALMEEVSFDRNSVMSREWGAYPIIKFPDIPKIDVLILPRQDEPPLGVGESASVPSAAAIANAIFDATGVRFRELPFTPERILAGLRGEHLHRKPRCRAWRQAPKPTSRTHQNPFAKPHGAFASVAAMVATMVSIAALRCRGGRSHRSLDRIYRHIRPRPSRRASNSQRSAIVRCAIPRPMARSMPAAARSRRRLASSTQPTSRPIPRPASARGRIPPSSGRCARASTAMGGIFIRHFPITILPRPPMPTCRRSMPI